MVPTSRYPVSTFSTLAGTIARKTFAAVTTVLFAITCIAQDNANNQTRVQPSDSQTTAQYPANPPSSTVTVPAGTRLPLVLTHPIQSRSIHRGDDIYAQITAPITLGNEVVIPPGTLVDGKVDKLQRIDGRAELFLQSMSITFPNGYVAPVSGPVVLESVEGYAVNDPGHGRLVGMFGLPAAGAGLGALIGHSIGQPQSEVNTTLPPGCVGAPPFCLSTTTPVFGTKGKDAIIGAGIGAAIGAATSMALLFSSHQFFLDVGSPVDMVLRQPILLEIKEDADAVRQSQQSPVTIQPIAPRPVPPPPPDITPDITPPPSTPGTPPIVIPGPPGPGGVPGPPIIIPGTPPSTL